MRFICAVLLVLGVILVLPASGICGFRCGEELITVGDLKPEVFSKCGPPSWVEGSHTPVPIQSSTFGYPAAARAYPAFPRKEIWYYNFGPSRLIEVLIFDNEGTLVEIRASNHGY